MTAVLDSPTLPDHGASPVLLGIPDIIELLPVARQTVYRWRSDSGGREVKLPPPYAVIAKTPVWFEEQILEFADTMGYKVDRKVLRRIRARFGR